MARSVAYGDLDNENPAPITPAYEQQADPVVELQAEKAGWGQAGVPLEHGFKLNDYARRNEGSAVHRVSANGRYPYPLEAIERLHVRRDNEGFTPLGVRCLVPEFGRMVGHAVTYHVETCSPGPIDHGKFMDLFQAVDASPKPAVVAVQEVGPNPEFAAHCGEVMATILTRAGAVGLVSDCGVRDLPEVRALRFNYFARGAVASHAYFRIVRVDIPIQICGLAIAPGDILHGDENGLLLVPREGMDRLATEVEAVRTRERALMDFVRGPDFTLEKLRNKILE